MAVHDFPAQQQYIRSFKDDDLIYIGHSMGTSLTYVLASKRPDVFDKIKAVFHLGPVAYFYRIRGMLKWMIPFLHPFTVSNICAFLKKRIQVVV